MRVLLVLLALLLTTSATSFASSAVEAGPAQRYIVGFYDLPDLGAGDAWNGGRVVGANEAIRFLLVETREGAAFEARAQLDENVRYVEWDNPLAGILSYVPNDARYNDGGHWGSKKIGAETAWDRTLGTSSMKVGIVDSGLLKTHEEFAGSGRVMQGYDFYRGDSDPNDECGHGTHVAGTIAATINNGKGIAGLAQVTVIPAKAFVPDVIGRCGGSGSAIASAMTYVADQGAAFSSNSWGGGASSAFNDAIDYSYTKGTIVVAAAGNDGACTNCVSQPWKSRPDKVIIVSSTTSGDGFSSFSSQGPEVDVSAPGSGILSSYTGGNNAYASASGTSMATPHVTGAAALIKTLNPTWGFANIDNRLKTTAVDLGTAGKDDRFGYGRINAAAATAGGGGPGNAAPTACFSHSETELTTSVNGGCSSDSDGSIVAYSWSWGDGTPSTSGSTATHTYAANGNYTVTLTVTDNNGATASTSQTVSVVSSDPDPAAPTLTNGVGKTGATSATPGSWQYYKINVPAGQSQLKVDFYAPVGCPPLLECNPNIDLYVEQGVRPTTTAYECASTSAINTETCTIASPGSGWWYIGVYVKHSSMGAASGYEVKATYS